MRFSITAVVLALPAIINAIPSPTYDARFAALTLRHARVAQRMANPLAERAELDVRQSSCTSQCSSTSDQSGIAAYNACSATDAACVCNALASLSSTCLTCALPAIGLSSSEYNQICGSGGTTSQCDSQCSDASDVAANNAAGECTTSSLDDPCVCAALGEMSSTCRNCLLQASGISSTDYNQGCSAANSTGGASGTTSASGSSSTSAGGASSCSSSCTSSSDQSALNAGDACSETDTTCECNALAELSSGCLSCVLSASDLTQQQYQQACGTSGGGGGSAIPASYSFTGAGSSATNTASASSSSSTSGSSSGTTGGGFSTPSCNSSCTASADQTAIAQGNTCPATNVACACAAFDQMDTTCRSCILSANGLTQSDLNSQCLAVSSQASASATATSSVLPSTSAKSGSLKGFRVGIQELMGVVAVALGVVIFV